MDTFTRLSIVLSSTSLVILVYFSIAAQVNGQTVFPVEFRNQADVTIYVTDFPNRADLLVYRVEYASQPRGNEGRWFFTEFATQAKKKIFFTRYRNRAQLTIHFVDYPNQARWRNSSKKHLMY